MQQAINIAMLDAQRVVPPGLHHADPVCQVWTCLGDREHRPRVVLVKTRGRLCHRVLLYGERHDGMASMMV
jgi:hypothetical protein